MPISYQKRDIRMVISDTAPLYPPLWGGPRRIWNLFSPLSKEHFDITYIGVKSRIQELQYSFQRINNNFKEILCSLPGHYLFWHIVDKVFFKNTSLDLFTYLLMHTDEHFKYVLNSQEADIVVFSHPWSSFCIRKKQGQLFIYDAHNCEYLLMGKILKRHLLKRLILRQVKKIESRACRESDLIIACSENEKNDLSRIYNIDPGKIVIIGNGAHNAGIIDRDKKIEYRGKLGFNDDKKVIIFIGAMYKPNNDAAHFIVEEMAPRLNNFHFLIVGSVYDVFRGHMIPDNVKFTGQISDEELNEALSVADIAINPMCDGSGTNIKMLDYMSYGLPIITTECGARGILTSGDQQPMIISGLDYFVNKLEELSRDQAQIMRMSRAGKNLVAGSYDWKILSRKLENAILEKLEAVS